MIGVVALLGLLGCGDAGFDAPPVGGAVPVHAAMARLAEVSGQGWVTCVLPPEAPVGLPRVLDGFVHREGDTVAFLVDTATGGARLFGPMPPTPPEGASDEAMRAYIDARAVAERPFATARWSGARGAQRGACTTEDAVPVLVSGRVEGSDKGHVDGCGRRFRVIDGAFQLQTWKGEPCELRHDSDPTGPPVVLDTLEPPREVTVPAKPGERTPAERVGRRVDEAAAALAEVEAQVAALRAAVQGAPPEAAPILATWLSEGEAERDRRADAHTKLVAFHQALVDAAGTHGHAPVGPSSP